MIGSLIPTLIVLGILIVIHEYGHFLACRIFKIKVEKFSIGFGPEIFKWKGKETTYVISLFPIGGYVKPAGESLSEIDPEKGIKEGDYLAAPLFARICVVCAGVVMNYLLAIFLFFVLFVSGRPIPGTVVGGLVPGYPAEAGGLMKKDKILKVNGVEVDTFLEMTRTLDQSPSEDVLLTLERSSEVLDIPVRLKMESVKDPFGKPHVVKRLGVMPSQEAAVFERYDPATSLKMSVQQTGFLAGMTYKAIFYLCLGKMSFKQMTGPVGIIAVTGEQAKLGWQYLVQLMAHLSISLAVINLLPIPALDGGHLFFLLIEAVRRKKVSLNFQDKASQVGFALLLVLMVFTVYNDLANLQVFSRIGKFLGIS